MEGTKHHQTEGLVSGHSIGGGGASPAVFPRDPTPPLVKTCNDSSGTCIH